MTLMTITTTTTSIRRPRIVITVIIVIIIIITIINNNITIAIPILPHPWIPIIYRRQWRKLVTTTTTKIIADSTS